MNTSNDGGSAFPIIKTELRYNPTIGAESPITSSVGGMSLRDYFAAAALQGMCALRPPFEAPNLETVIQNRAQAAYEYADAMLKARGS